jgi:hypothetical protein
MAGPELVNLSVLTFVLSTPETAWHAGWVSDCVEKGNWEHPWSQLRESREQHFHQVSDRKTIFSHNILFNLSLLIIDNL